MPPSLSLPTGVFVYYCTQPNAPITPLYPALRTQEIEASKSERVKREKFFVWKLLEYALREAYQLSITNLTFQKGANGKWQTDNGVHFSLSHCQNALCVALSNAPVGVDLQVVALPKRIGTINKLFQQDEQAYFETLGEQEKAVYFTQKWTQAESAFKLLNLSAFFPNKLQLNGVPTYPSIVQIGETDYALCVASQAHAKIHLAPLPLSQFLSEK